MRFGLSVAEQQRELGMEMKGTYDFAIPADPSGYYYAGQSHGSSLRLKVSGHLILCVVTESRALLSPLILIYVPARKATRAPP